MSLNGKILLTVDTLECGIRNKKTGKVISNGNTTKASFTNSVEKLDLFDGIGMKKRATLKSKKVTEIAYTVNAMDVEVMAAEAGVAIDRNSKGSYKWEAPVTVTGGEAEIADATRILGVWDASMSPMAIVSEAPASDEEVKVVNNTLTFNTEYAGDVYVTYETTAVEGDKDVLTIEFNAEKFAERYEFFSHGVAYDADTEEICADVYVDYYDCTLDDGYTWSFEGNQNTATEVKLSVNTPKYLPDGSVNKDSKQGVFKVVER